jgi:hypothetical protein
MGRPSKSMIEDFEHRFLARHNEQSLDLDCDEIDDHNYRSSNSLHVSQQSMATSTKWEGLSRGAKLLKSKRRGGSAAERYASHGRSPGKAVGKLSPINVCPKPKRDTESTSSASASVSRTESVFEVNELMKSHKTHISDDLFFISEENGSCNGISEPSSPRSKFILACLSKRITPKASLIVRKQLTRRLELQHQGIGDEMAAQLASCLQFMPCLEEINLADNNLTDDGMGPILDSILSVETLRELNLSENEIGGVAAEALGNYLDSEKCPLEKLVLHKSDVDDFEGERFVNSLQNNKSIKEIDLSYNKIGSAENLNTVFPDLTTATEAMAELIAREDCPLNTLKLSWNMMRLDSACQFARAMGVNSSITYLDISYNAFGNDAGCVLGDALLDNKTLKTLLISNNNIDARACFTICAAVQENFSIRRVSMDGNPIGEGGAKALMILPTAVGTRVTVSANNCNTNIRDPLFWFDQNAPCREYELNLTDPFERAVAFQLLNIVAAHQTLVVMRASYEPRPGKIEKLEFVQSIFHEKCNYLDDEQAAVLENLIALRDAAGNTDEAIRLFQKYDEDQSGALDKSELKHVLHDFGMQIPDSKLDDFILLYDVDGAGLIELPEFLSFVKSQQQEAHMRIRDMTENMGMALESAPDVKYAPPREGILRLEVIDSFTRKANYQVISVTDQSNLSLVAKNTGDAAKLMGFGFQHSKIRLSEALSIYNTMIKEGGEKISTLSKLLPQIETSDEARTLIFRVTNNDRVELSRVKLSMGSALKPILGMPNGYYILDLSKDTDRICLSRLLEFSNTYRFHGMSKSKLGFGIVGDTSQRGNWSCFRNEM